MRTRKIRVVKNNCYTALTSKFKASYFDHHRFRPFRFRSSFFFLSLFFHLDQIISIPWRKSVQFDELLCGCAPVFTARGPLWWPKWQRICLHCRRPRSNPWVRKISWRREELNTPVFLPGEFHEQRSLVGHIPQGSKESDTTEQLTNSQLEGGENVQVLSQ